MLVSFTPLAANSVLLCACISGYAAGFSQEFDHRDFDHGDFGSSRVVFQLFGQTAHADG